MTIKAQVTADEGTTLRVLTFKDFATLSLDEELTIVFDGSGPDPVAEALDNIEKLGRRMIALVEIKRVQLYTGIIEDARAEAYWDDRLLDEAGDPPDFCECGCETGQYTSPANDDTAGMTYEEGQKVRF